MKKSSIRRVTLSLFVCMIAGVLFGCNTNGKQETEPKLPEVTLTPTVQPSAVATPEPTATPEPPKYNQNRIKAKGLYLTASSAGARLEHYIELANTTEINSYVIDLKDDYGVVSYASQVPMATEIGAIEKLYNAEELVKKLHDNDIYAIARIVCFKDPILAEKKPDMAIKNTEGGLYVHNEMNWVNPYDQNVWQYNVDLAREALELGFDEVQFDYIRFPDGRKSEMVFANKDDREIYEVINDFLAYAREQLPTAIISGDVFAIILESPGDTEGIGQYFEYIGENLDYLCPMAYPSHYANGQVINGVSFPKPDLDPYGIIKNTLLKAKSRYEKVDGNKPILRTFMQDFSATWIGNGNWQYYEDEQIRQQIQAVYDAGYEEWFLWDPMNNYREGAFVKE